MSKCKNEVLLSKIGMQKLSKQTEVTLEVLDDLPDCKKINAKNYIFRDSDNEEYKPFDRPVDVFECKAVLCNNTGTLTMSNDDTTTNPVVSANYRIPFDARDFAAGIITFYVKSIADEAVNGRFKIYAVGDDANYDEYDFTSVEGEGFHPIVIDLTKDPDNVGGTGWEAIENGAVISIEVPSGVGISSIAVFDEIIDFETSSIVKIGCLSDVGGSIDLDVQQATCWGSGYNTTDLPTIEKTIVGNSVSPNYWKLNPMLKRGGSVKSFEIVTVEKQLVLSADGKYAIAQLPDAYEDECGFYGANIADVCDFTGALIERLTLPVGVDIDERHFLVAKSETGGTVAYFNAKLEGQRVIISYPAAVDVDERVANFDNVGMKRVRMFVPKTLTDGTKIVNIYDNVLVTSFPEELTNEETEFSFTINIQPDVSGNYYREGRIIG